MATYRASSSAYVVLGVIWLLLGVLGTVAGVRTHIGWLPALISFAVLAVVVFWLRSFRLTITERSLTYRSLFGGERSVELLRISAVNLASRTGPYESPLTAVVAINGGPDLRVNTKVFPREAGEALFSLKRGLD